MKKLSLLVLILFTLITITSCEEEGSTLDNNILGQWQNISMTETATENQVLLYLFNDDNTIEITRIITDARDNTLGYILRATGTFTFDGNQLNIDIKEVFQNADTDNGYSALEDLVLVEYIWSEEALVQFQDDFYQMTMDYTNCGPADNCLTRQTFTRTYSRAQI